MPYIEHSKREDFDEEIDILACRVESVGDMNYVITKFLHAVLEKKGVCYTNINSMIGVLECAKIELYRQIANKYENKKKMANGPVSTLDQINMEDIR